MTDKQIIIDGVDVSGCGYIDQDSAWCDLCMTNCAKETKPCYYKQLKRKEQEYEELRKYHNKCCEEFEKEKKEWLEKFNQISRDFYNGEYCNTKHCSLLKAKEQECEELKKKCNIYTCGICGNKEYCNKLYKTLTEIKEILLFNKKELEECLHNDIDGQILQKISEVLE